MNRMFLEQEHARVLATLPEETTANHMSAL
jgi:hypothetical protein